MTSEVQSALASRVPAQNTAAAPSPACGPPADGERGPISSRKRPLRGRWWRWPLLVVLPLAAMGAAFAAAKLQSPSYTSQTSLLISFGREYVFRPLVGSGENMLPWRPEAIVNSELEILNSGDVSRHVVRTIGPARLIGPGEPGIEEARAFEKALQIVRSGLTLKGVKDSNVVHVYFRHSSPEVAQQSLRALLEGYFQRRAELYRTQDAAFLEDLVKAQQAAVEAATIDLQEHKRKLGLLRYEAERNALQERESALLSERDRLKRAEVEALGERRALEPLRGADANDQGQIEARIAGAAAALATLDGSLAEVRERLDRIEANRDSLERLAGKVEYEQKRLEQSRLKLDEAKLSEALDRSGLSNVRMIESPQVPLRKDGLSLSTMLAVAGLAGLFAAMTLILLTGGRSRLAAEHIPGLVMREEPSARASRRARNPETGPGHPSPDDACRQEPHWRMAQ